jgi:hypothetical protein
MRAYVSRSLQRKTPAKHGSCFPLEAGFLNNVKGKKDEKRGEKKGGKEEQRKPFSYRSLVK